jgi:hypothetical protein
MGQPARQGLAAIAMPDLFATGASGLQRSAASTALATSFAAPALIRPASGMGGAPIQSAASGAAVHTVRRYAGRSFSGGATPGHVHGHGHEHAHDHGPQRGGQSGPTARAAQIARQAERTAAAPMPAPPPMSVRRTPAVVVPPPVPPSARDLIERTTVHSSSTVDGVLRRTVSESGASVSAPPHIPGFPIRRSFGDHGGHPMTESQHVIRRWGENSLGQPGFNARQDEHISVDEDAMPKGRQLDELVDHVVERIEQRVIDELERRGRRSDLRGF